MSLQIMSYPLRKADHKLAREDITYQRCDASDNQMLQSVANLSTGAIGFEILTSPTSTTSENIVFEDCTAFRNRAPADQFASLGVGGFLIKLSGAVDPGSGGTRNTVFRRCIANNNQADEANTFVAGFMSNSTRDDDFANENSGLIFEECIAQSNINLANEARGFGILFGVDGSDFGFTTRSRISSCQLIDNGIGISLRNTATNFNLIQDNTVQANTVIGIEDRTGNIGNLYTNNFLYNPGAINHVGLPAPTPIRTWPLPAGPSAVNNFGVSGEKLDNIDVF